MSETLAQLVRKRFPGSYDDLSDQELEQRVAAKFPGVYDDIPRTSESGKAMAPESRRQAEFMAGSKVASRPYEEPSTGGRVLGDVIGAGTAAALGGTMLGAAGAMGGRVAGALRASPAATGAVVAAAPDLLQGDLQGAAVSAGLGALGVKGAKGAYGKVVDAVAESVAAKVATKAAPAVAAAAKAASPGAARVAAHAKIMAFAKEAAAKAPKLGEKIWMELDEAGLPVRVLTPDQAGAVKRAGKATTWVKNLWQ